jgi:hypothetical protein
LRGERHIPKRSRAEQTAAADAFQRPLRARFQARLSAAVRHQTQHGMTKSDWDYRGLAADCYNLWFGDEPFWDQAFFHDRIRRNGGVALEMACGTGRLLVPFLRDGLVVANLATAPLQPCGLKPTMSRPQVYVNVRDD